MDTAVSLVQAYLHVNGYFTVAEYPVLEAMKGGSHRTLTDIDMLAYRLPHAGGLLPASRRRNSPRGSSTVLDPRLQGTDESADLLLAEVKEGRAELNPGARDPDVLRAVLVRFGACAPPKVDEAVESLVRHGRTRLESGCLVRLVAFGSLVAPESSAFLAIPLDHVVSFLQGHLRRHWELLRHAQIKDPAYGFLVTLEKVRLGSAAGTGANGAGGLPTPPRPGSARG